MKPLIGIPTFTHEVEGSVRYEGLATYTRAIERAGGAPIFIPLDLGDDALRIIFDRMDGLLFQGGGDVHPSEYGESVAEYCGAIDRACDETELRLLRWSFDTGKPLLAICRGIQVLNVAAGGSLYQDIDAQLPTSIRHPHRKGNPSNYRAHAIEIEPNSRLARAVGTTRIEVNSRHHQSVKQVAPGFHVTARAPDGVIEAIESTNGNYALGVQFHPENLIDDDPRILQMFKEFIQAVSERMRSAE
ncbi:MAG: gamma-glutamyl-gamma-aminobutyrate hydrolase family protein [Chloroflexi bacterium]|nr:gamma-glutamyl-gamma-aminobutyrate hydrolase family protein [Chloroflexota bacterium]